MNIQEADSKYLEPASWITIVLKNIEYDLVGLV